MSGLIQCRPGKRLKSLSLECTVAWFSMARAWLQEQHRPAGHDPQKAQGHNPGDRHGLASANALLPPGLGLLMVGNDHDEGCPWAFWTTENCSTSS